MLPFTFKVDVPDLPDLDLTLPTTDVPVLIPPGSITLPAPVQPSPQFAFPPIGLNDWDRDAGQRIADSLTTLMGLSRRSYPVAVVFAMQAAIEDGHGTSVGAQNNNPLNLSDAGGSITWPGQTGRYFDRFAAFDTLQSGCRACALNYYNGAGYENVRKAFIADDWRALADAIQASPWDEGHYGGTLTAKVAQALGQ